MHLTAIVFLAAFSSGSATRIADSSSYMDQSILNHHGVSMKKLRGEIRILKSVILKLTSKVDAMNTVLEGIDSKISAMVVNGGFSSWSHWSSCTASCGDSTKTRNRECNSPAPKNGGKNCVGVSNETVTCNVPACPINGGFSSWSQWSLCTGSCGNSTKTRNRECNSPAPKNGGKNCVGVRNETVACNVTVCPKFRLVAESKTCDGWHSNGGFFKTAKECFESCSGRTYMFTYGRKGISVEYCHGEGCACFCELATKDAGKCKMEDDPDFDLYLIV